MALQPTPKPPRAILTSLPEKYSLPGKPSGATAPVLDAHRQTGFLLGDELALFERAMNEVLSVIRSAKPKGPRSAAMLSVGGRAFVHLADACTLMCYGSYVSCPPLVRMALEAIAVESALVRDDFGPYEEWYGAAVTQDREHSALRIDLGHSKAASVLVADENLGELYRLLMDLAMPHFGSALLFGAPDVSLQKVPLAFAENSFHLALAQLVSGWLLRLSIEQASLMASAFDAPADATEAIRGEVAGILADRRRCYVERLDDGWLLHNFRRAASGQPKRVILG